ncbi:auxin-responsive protein IAA28 isoform X1 [Brassica napus]|uniref:auxin-responsive protein IAA28 isoform X1 n=1 Tax=Brassica napus TaxID=3708 RepID=UPI002079F582|nr:auxin-responsive protein IAA28 isoform X1 [Brassica napus]
MEEEKRLELRLAPPCQQVTSNNNINESTQRSLTKETAFVFNNRAETAPVVGWPPVRSSRRNLTVQPKEEMKKGVNDELRELYVKINMEGVPIGRKVNLSALNNYQQLSHAVDQLFSKKDLADVNRQYTLVYEDTEGDTVLVGDVPWEMFVSTVKRLRVLKTSHASMLSQNMARNKVRLPISSVRCFV